MKKYVKFICLVNSSLVNILRYPSSPGGCGVGEVGLLMYSDPPLTHSLSISSRWILSIVATAWVGSIATYVTLSVLGLPGSSDGMLSQFTTALSNT